ncbi:hypothetical protein [Efunavirus EF1]|uniref:Capsid and scaffold protein n=1 Tax=Enterococcus phage EF1 TaxID=2025813 RepID=A0A249XXV1_9CAUD|nr:hypothetical protein [Enterococcus phage EF1]ASZ77381.1 hypothetical protein [Enterococcus phage EF5]
MATVSRGEITITNVNDGRTPYFHTAYTNSTDFGSYDYSGNPNLMVPLKASDFYPQSGATIEDYRDALKVTFTKTDGAVFLGTSTNIPALLPNTQYTLSADVTVSEGYTGKLENLRLGYRKFPGGTIILPLTAKDAVVGQKTRISITANSSAATDSSKFDRMYFTINTTSTEPFVGTALIENIKVEQGTAATPYQPNIKGAPWYFSTVSLGKNLITNAQFPIKTSNDPIAGFDILEELTIGETYTVSLKGTKLADKEFQLYYGDAGNYQATLRPVEGLTDVWSATFTASNSTGTSNLRRVALWQKPNSVTNGNVQIDWLKIEKGDTRTPNIDNYNYLGNYTDFVQADSLNPTKYAWSLIKGTDGETSHIHTAYAWSADGTDRFTKVYPQVNLLENTKNPISSKTVRVKGSTHSNTDDVTFKSGITHQERKPNYPIGEMYYRFMSTADGNLASTNLVKGETYYLGLDLRAELAEGDYVTWRAQYKKSTGSWIDVDGWKTGVSKIEGVTSEFKRFENALTIPKDAVTLYFSYQVYPKSGKGVATGSIVEFKNAKFALKSATPYTPTPEEDYENAYPSYTGTYSDFNVKGSDNPKDYTWARSMGSDGESAKTLILSTSSNTVKINQDSSIQSDTITLQANMQNMTGIATFSATPYIGARPQTAITLGGTGNTRTFSTSSWNKNWTSLVVTATFESFIDKQTIISVREGKDGADSITGLLTNESVTLPADKNGIVESFSEASGTFKVFDGLSDVTGRNVVYTLKNKSGGTFNINASTGVYNMTEMSKDSAIAVFEATYKNIKIEKILSVAKSKAGKETYTYTKYSNSKDFGNYDYSGNPNIAPIINDDNVKSLNNSMTTVTNHGTYATAEKIGNDLTVGVGMFPWSRYDFSKLTVGKQYTLTIPIRINESYNGDISRLFIRLRCLDKDNNALIIITVMVPKNTPKGVFTNISATFNVQASTQVSHSWYAQVGSSTDYSSRGSIDIGYEVKLEEGAVSTPYQPNLLDEPYYLSKVALGENLIKPESQQPVTNSNYLIKIYNTKPMVKGKKYTITLEGTKPATQVFRPFFTQATGSPWGFGDLKPVEGLTDIWSATFTASTDSHPTSPQVQIYQVPNTTVGQCTIKWVKLEEGDTRTPNIDSYKYMGIYVGGESEQPHNPTQYAWSQIKGNDSTSYSLLLSSQVMSLPRGASKLVPENITISGMAQTGEKSIENIKSRIVVEETTNGTTWTTKYDADALTYTYTPSSLNVLSARVKMYVAGAKNVQLDQKSINIVKDGSNGSNGSNGSSSYTWIRYSENANGNPMTTTPNSKTKYIGIAITQTSTAPSAYSSYTWSRIKGSGGLVAKVYSNGGTNIEQSPIQINVETQSDGDIVEPNKVTWYMSKDSSAEWTAITAGNGITLNKKYIVVEPVVFLESNSISFKAQVEYNSMTAFDYMTVNNKSFDATKPLILRQPAAPLNPYPGLLWLDTSSGSGDPLDKTNPSLVYRWGKSAIESVNGTEYAHYAYANTPTGYQEDGVTPDPSFSVTYNSSQKPMYIGHCVTDTASDPTTPSSYNWKSITTENGSEDVNSAKGIAQEKIETTYAWGWVVLSASDLEMLPWLNNEDGSTIIDWIYQITQKTSDDSIVQTVVGSEDMSKVYAKTDAVDELSSANHELSDKIEEYNKQMQDAFAGIDTTYVNKSEFEQEMNKFNFGIDKAGGVNLIRNSTGFQWEDTAPSDEMLTNPKFEGTISTTVTGLNNNGWVYNGAGIGQVIGAESDFPENKIMRIGGTNSPTKYSYSKDIPVSPGQLINISGQVRIPNTIGNTKNAYLSIRFYARSDPSFSAASQTIGNGQGVITLFTDKTDFAGTVFGTDSYTVKTNNIVQDIWSNYSINITIPTGAAFMKVLFYNDSTTPTNYFDFRKPSVVLYSGMFDFWHKNDSANAQIRQILGDESLEELGLIAGFELKGLRYKLDQDILLPNPNTEYTLSWYANKISRSGKSKYYVKVLNTKTGAEIAVSEASADTIGYQRMSVTFSVTNTSAVTIRIGLEGEGSADATLSAAGLMINIGPYPLSWQSHHEEVYSTNVRIDSSGLKVFNSDYDGYNVMTPREFAGYYRNGEVYERVFTLNKDTTKVKKLEAQERFMMKPVQIVSVDSPTIQGWAFVGYNGEDTD